MKIRAILVNIYNEKSHPKSIVLIIGGGDMELTHIDFSYNIAKKEFTRMHYRFEVAGPNESRDALEDIIDLAKASLSSLENIIDPHYKSFRKTEAGDIDSKRIKFGHEYKPLFGMVAIPTVTIKYDLKLTDKNCCDGLDIVYYNNDLKSKRILRIHDDLLVLRDLYFSKEAKVQIDNIKYLRSKKFNIDEYIQKLR